MPQPWARPGECRTVCRPVRHPAQRWTARAIGRVARYAVRDGVVWTSVYREVLAESGDLGVVCAGNSAIRLLLDVIKVLVQPPAVAERPDPLLRTVRRLLLALARVSGGRVRVIILLLAGLITAVIALEDRISDLQRLSVLLDDVCST